MGAHTARVDASTVHDVARQFEATAALLDAAVRTHVSGLRFGGATAGRAHMARGELVRTSLTWIGAGIAQWSRASEEIAAALRGGADRYRQADDRTSARVG